MPDYHPHELNKLRKEYGYNKRIPKKYESAILTALSFYPELKNVHIEFKLKYSHPVPYGTMPTPGSIFRHAEGRTYVVSILEDADPPMYGALFKNLPFEAQVAVIGHEVAHVVQFNSCTRLQLAKTLFLYLRPSFQQKIERNADMGAILHGLGSELYEHAVYIRNIPGYLEERKEIERNYLKPVEIMEAMKNKMSFK